MKPDFVSTSGRYAFARRQVHVERLPVIGLRAHARVEARHGLHVVIEDVRPGVEHARHGVEIAAKIRRQHFHARFGKRAAHLRARSRRSGASRRPARSSRFTLVITT